MDPQTRREGGGASAQELNARYDRQIRVWGAEAQQRIQTSRVLVVGLSGLNVEVVKNIVLAGMNVTIQDASVVRAEDLSFNFFLSLDEVGNSTIQAALPRIQQLNTFTTVGVETRPLRDLDDAFFAPFTVILVDARCSTQDEAVRINRLCRNSCSSGHSKVFFLSDVFGQESMFISDFGTDFKYQVDKKDQKEGVAKEAAVQQLEAEIHTVAFPPLEEVLEKQWVATSSKHFPLSKTFVKARLLAQYRDLHGGKNPLPGTHAAFLTWASSVFSQQGLSPDAVPHAELETLARTADCTPIVTCSTLGSFLAQEVIKGVSLSGKPGFNVFVFSCEDYQVRVIPI
jgi:ubiquitin-like 1-activating enzyme E1 A